MTDHTTDIAIIGAGPVGLFAVFQCGMLDLKCHVIDALPEIGGQCTALYPEKPIYDIPAYPEISGGDLIENLVDQAAPFDPHYHLSQQVVELTGLEDGRWHLKTNQNTVIDAGAVIIAGGPGSFGPNKPPLKRRAEFEGTSLFYAVRDPDQFTGKDIVIAGGGDSAVDWALDLYDSANSLTLVHRRDKFRAHAANVTRLRQLATDGKINLEIPYMLSRLSGDDGELQSVTIRTMEGEEKELQCDALLPFFGLSSKLGPIKQWGLSIKRNQIEIDPTSGATGIDGVFAIGDIAAYENKLKLILTGFSEAAMAAHGAHRHIHPDQPIHFQHSTDKGVPGK
jgi:thioredoxin reductase (NADPH)